MVNLIAEEEVVPELVQHDFTAANVVARLKEILPDGPARDRMLEGLARVKARLRAPGRAAVSTGRPAADIPCRPRRRTIILVMLRPKHEACVRRRTAFHRQGVECVTLLELG